MSCTVRTLSLLFLLILLPISSSAEKPAIEGLRPLSGPYADSSLSLTGIRPTFDMADSHPGKLSIGVTTATEGVESVRFKIGRKIAVDSKPPFCLGSRKNGCSAFRFKPGKGKIIATPFAKKKARGKRGKALKLPYRIVNSRNNVTTWKNPYKYTSTSGLAGMTAASLNYKKVQKSGDYQLKNLAKDTRLVTIQDTLRQALQKSFFLRTSTTAIRIAHTSDVSKETASYLDDQNVSADKKIGSRWVSWTTESQTAGCFVIQIAKGPYFPLRTWSDKTFLTAEYIDCSEPASDGAYYKLINFENLDAHPPFSWRGRYFPTITSTEPELKAPEYESGYYFVRIVPVISKDPLNPVEAPSDDAVIFYWDTTEKVQENPLVNTHPKIYFDHFQPMRADYFDFECHILQRTYSFTEGFGPYVAKNVCQDKDEGLIEKAVGIVSDLIEAVKGFVDTVSAIYNDVKATVVNYIAEAIGCSESPTCKNGLNLALTYAMASAGIPPTIPNSHELIADGKEYLAEVVVQETGIPQEAVDAARSYVEERLEDASSSLTGDDAPVVILDGRFQYRPAMLRVRVERVVTSPHFDALSHTLTIKDESGFFKEAKVHIPANKLGISGNYLIPVFLEPVQDFREWLYTREELLSSIDYGSGFSVDAVEQMIEAQKTALAMYTAFYNEAFNTYFKFKLRTADSIGFSWDQLKVNCNSAPQCVINP